MTNLGVVKDEKGESGRAKREHGRELRGEGQTLKKLIRTVEMKKR